MAYKEVEIVEEDGRRVTRKRFEGGKEAAKTGVMYLCRRSPGFCYMVAV